MILPSATEELSLAVFHDRDPDRLFVILTTYIDESGTHGEPTMILGGRVAALGQWIDFDKKWKRLLKKEEIPYFHGTDMLGRKKQFRGWSDSRCLRFIERAQRIVGRHTRIGFAANIDIHDYKTVYRAAERPRKLKIDSKYGLCFRVMLVEMPRLIRRSLPDGNHTIHFVLESGDANCGDAKAIFDEAKKGAPDELRSMLGTLTYGDKADFPGLQAADMISFGALHAERKGSAELTHLPGGEFTVAEMERAVPYRSPIMRYDVTREVMLDFVEKGKAEIEERRRWWFEGRKHPKKPD